MSMPRATMSVATRTRNLPRLEAGECLGPLRLRAVAVDPLGGDAVLHEEVVQPVGAVLGAGEDQHLLHLAALQQGEQECRLQFLGHRVDRLGDADRGLRLALEVDHHRVLQHLAHQRHDRRWHRRREEEGLPLGGHVLEDATDVGQEAHVEHPVGLVQHEVLDPRQLGVGGLEVVQQPARRGDHHVHATAEGMLLGPHADAPEDGRTGDRGMDGQVVQVGQDLGGQFTGWRQHQRPGGAPGLVHQVMEDRQQEGSGLAASGLGTGENVPPSQAGRDSIGLDRGGSGKTEFLDAAEKVRVEGKTTERHAVSWVRDSISQLSS